MPMPPHLLLLHRLILFFLQLIFLLHHPCLRRIQILSFPPSPTPMPTPPHLLLIHRRLDCLLFLQLRLLVFFFFHLRLFLQLLILFHHLLLLRIWILILCQIPSSYAKASSSVFCRVCSHRAFLFITLLYISFKKIAFNVPRPWWSNFKFIRQPYVRCLDKNRKAFVLFYLQQRLNAKQSLLMNGRKQNLYNHHRCGLSLFNLLTQGAAPTIAATSLIDLNQTYLPR